MILWVEFKFGLDQPACACPIGSLSAFMSVYAWCFIALKLTAKSYRPFVGNPELRRMHPGCSSFQAQFRTGDWSAASGRHRSDCARCHML